MPVIAAIEGIALLVVAIGAVLALLAAPAWGPRPVVLTLLGIAEAAVLVSVVLDVVVLAGGWRTPGLATHISYLVSTPFVVPAGFGLTYKKFDRWGLLILGIATFIAGLMVVRHVQTLGVPFGYLNV